MNLEQLVKDAGWILECESPLEIGTDDGESRATGEAALILIDYFQKEEEQAPDESIRIIELGHGNVLVAALLHDEKPAILFRKAAKTHEIGEAASEEDWNNETCCPLPGDTIITFANCESLFVALERLADTGLLSFPEKGDA